MQSEVKLRYRGSYFKNKYWHPRSTQGGRGGLFKHDERVVTIKHSVEPPSGVR